MCVCVLGYALFVMMNEALITNAGKRMFFFPFRLMLTIRLRDYRRYLRLKGYSQGCGDPSARRDTSFDFPASSEDGNEP